MGTLFTLIFVLPLLGLWVLATYAWMKFLYREFIKEKK